MAVRQIKVGSWCVRWLWVRLRPFSEYLLSFIECHKAASTLSLPPSISVSLFVWVRQEVRQNESSCLCLYRPQCVFKGFNRTHCCITVIIFLCCVYVRLYRPEMFAKARMFFQWRLQHEHTSSVWLWQQEAACVCVCVCECASAAGKCVCSPCVRVANDHNVSWHITQRISIYVVGYNESIFDISSCAGDVIGSVVGERRWGFSRRTRWMDVSVVRWITVCFLSRPGSFCTQCEAGSNLAKSVFHLSLEQTGAGEPAPICYRCEIPAPLNLILKQQMDACQVCLCVCMCVCICWKSKQLFCCATRKDAGLHSSWIYQDTQSIKPTGTIMLILISHVVNPQREADISHKIFKFHLSYTIYQILL